jgi:hypothetical protein
MKSHKLVEGMAEIGLRYRDCRERNALFEELYDRISNNWRHHREPGRRPSAENWKLRVMPKYTEHPRRYIEKQLQKQIVICLGHDGWGNDMPTASGLVDSRSRQMNIDIVHDHGGGFELFEVKVASDTPYDAALQILRYGALYMLYRCEHELTECVADKPIMHTSKIGLKVLAPHRYYSRGNVDLPNLERQLDSQVQSFAARCNLGVALSFSFVAFPPDFEYSPGMGCCLIRAAIQSLISPFSRLRPR